MPEETTLARVARRGGTALMVRQVVGAGVGVVGVLVQARLVGAEAFGQFAAVLALATLVGSWSFGGLAALIIRRAGEDAQMTARVLGMAIVQAGIVVGIAGGLAMLLLPESLRVILPWLMLMLGVQVFITMAQIPLGLLEHRLCYSTIAGVEFAGQVLGVTTGCLVAWWTGPGFAWPLVVGWATHQMVLAMAWLVLGGGLPVPRWDVGWHLVRERWSTTVIAATSQARFLILPFVVAGGVDGQALGHLGLAQRLSEAAGLPRMVLQRLSVPLLTRLSPAQVRNFIGVGGGMIALATGGAFVATILLLHLLSWVDPAGDWGATARLVPWCVPAAMVAGYVILPSALLQQQGRVGLVSLIHLVQVVVWAGVTAFLLPTWGVWSLPVAELLAVPILVVMAVVVARAGNPVPWWSALVMVGAWTVAGWAPTLGWWALFAPVLLVAMPGEWERWRQAVQVLRGRHVVG